MSQVNELRLEIQDLEKRIIKLEAYIEGQQAAAELPTSTGPGPQLVRDPAETPAATPAATPPTPPAQPETPSTPAADTNEANG